MQQLKEHCQCAYVRGRLQRRGKQAEEHGWVLAGEREKERERNKVGGERQRLKKQRKASEAAVVKHGRGEENPRCARMP